MGSYEWIILEVGFLGLLVWELYRVRRDIKWSRAADAAIASPLPSREGPGVGEAAPLSRNQQTEPVSPAATRR